MVVWAVVIPMFWYLTLTNLTQGRLGTRARSSALTRALAGNHAVILTVAYLVVVAVVTERFWTYWSTLLS